MQPGMEHFWTKRLFQQDQDWKEGSYAIFCLGDSHKAHLLSAILCKDAMQVTEIAWLQQLVFAHTSLAVLSLSYQLCSCTKVSKVSKSILTMSNISYRTSSQGKSCDRLSFLKLNMLNRKWLHLKCSMSNRKSSTVSSGQSRRVPVNLGEIMRRQMLPQ